MIALRSDNDDIILTQGEVNKAYANAKLLALAILGLDLKKPIGFDRANVPDNFLELFHYYLKLWKDMDELLSDGVPEWEVREAVKSDKILITLLDARKEPLYGTKEYIENRATELCVTKQTKYRKQKKATAREERFIQDLAKAIKVGEIPHKSVPEFTDLYKDAWSRICMIRLYKRKILENGKKVGNEKNQWVGMNLQRLVQYLAETNPYEPIEDLQDDIKTLKRTCQTKIDTDFCEGYFKFQEFVRSGEQLMLRDLQTFNVVHLLKGLCQALPHRYYKQFYETLIYDPWLRCSRNTGRFIFSMCLSEIKKSFEQKLKITIKKLHFSTKEKIPYYRFKFVNEDNWHSAETEMEAKVVAEWLGREIESIERVEPKYKALEILDSGGCPIEHYVDSEGDWAKSEPRANYFNEL